MPFALRRSRVEFGLDPQIPIHSDTVSSPPDFEVAFQHGSATNFLRFASFRDAVKAQAGVELTLSLLVGASTRISATLSRVQGGNIIRSVVLNPDEDDLRRHSEMNSKLYKGDPVVVTVGIFKGTKGEVISHDGDIVTVATERDGEIQFLRSVLRGY